MQEWLKEILNKIVNSNCLERNELLIIEASLKLIEAHQDIMNEFNNLDITYDTNKSSDTNIHVDDLVRVVVGGQNNHHHPYGSVGLVTGLSIDDKKDRVIYQVKSDGVTYYYYRHELEKGKLVWKRD